MMVLLTKSEYDQYTEENYHKAYQVFEKKVEKFRQDVRTLVSEQQYCDPVFIARLHKLIDSL